MVPGVSAVRLARMVTWSSWLPVERLYLERGEQGFFDPGGGVGHDPGGDGQRIEQGQVPDMRRWQIRQRILERRMYRRPGRLVADLAGDAAKRIADEDGRSLRRHDVEDPDAD